MTEIITIYQGDDACTQCLGWKRVSDGAKLSWKYWAEMPAPSNFAVQAGLVKPITCPHCKGTGVEPQEEEA